MANVRIECSLQRRNGLYLPLAGVSGVDRIAQEARAKDVFLTLLARFNKSNRNVSDKKSANFAPAVFAREDEAKADHLNSKLLENAMRELFKEDRIWNEPYGKPSRGSFRIAKRTQ